MLLPLTLLAISSSALAVVPIQGTKCTRNQVINRLTVYEDGALEAECGPLPCGESGMKCIDDQASCRAETDVFSGMRWAANGLSVLMRCCTMRVPNKIYIGSDLVTAGSYYQGGAVAKKDHYDAEGGEEFDFIANVRTEQGGVRVWVYRVMCPAGATTTMASKTFEKEMDDNQEEEEVEEGEESAEVTEDNEQHDEEPAQVDQVAAAPFNPLRYRPSKVQRSSTGVRRA